MFVQDNYNSTVFKLYDVGIYLRLSREDETTGQSESIENQKKLLERYVIEQGWNIKEVYIDDGYSGLTFDRPSFNKMIADIENKKINLVITKDLSRLGRDYIETGYYLERFFPEKQIRYIALSDSIDTYMANGNNDLTPFKAVINDMYARDISKKIRVVMDSKRKNGEFVSAFAPYGYKRDTHNKNKLLIDENVSHIVKRIFDLYVSGKGINAIAKILNEEKIISPLAYKETFCNFNNPRTIHRLWKFSTVRQILINQIYIGNLIQKKAEKINYKSKMYRKVPESEWIAVFNTHEPIVSEEQFYLVQELIRKNVMTYTKKEGATHLLNGLVFCKECGSKFTYRQAKGRKMAMNCQLYWKLGKNFCKSHVMTEYRLDNYVLKNLKEISEKLIDDNFYEQFKGLQQKKESSSNEDEIKRIEYRFDEIKKIVKSVYEDKVRGIITDDTFIDMSKDYNTEKENLNVRYQILIKQIKEDKTKKNIRTDYLNLLKDIVLFDKADKSILCQLINKIEIDQDRNIYISYNFDNPFLEEKNT